MSWADDFFNAIFGNGESASNGGAAFSQYALGQWAAQQPYIGEYLSFYLTGRDDLSDLTNQVGGTDYSGDPLLVGSIGDEEPGRSGIGDWGNPLENQGSDSPDGAKAPWFQNNPDLLADNSGTVVRSSSGSYQENQIDLGPPPILPIGYTIGDDGTPEVVIRHPHPDRAPSQAPPNIWYFSGRSYGPFAHGSSNERWAPWAIEKVSSPRYELTRPLSSQSGEPNVLTTFLENLNVEYPADFPFVELTPIDYRNPDTVVNPLNPDLVDLSQRLHRDYPDIFPNVSYILDLSTWPKRYPGRAGGTLTGVFVLLGKSFHPENSDWRGGLYFSVSYSEEHGVGLALVGELGRQQGPFEITEGFEGGWGSKVPEGKQDFWDHLFFEPTRFVQAGGEKAGVGIAGRTTGIGEPGWKYVSQGQVSPFVFTEIRGVTVAVGVDADLARGGF